MPDIPDSHWSERDDRNAENAPLGWPPGLPAFIEQIGQMMMGAIKRFWNRSNPVYLTTGTGDDYVVTPESRVAFINIYEVVRVRIDRANTTTTPTLKWSDANPRVIVKFLAAGVAPLAVGDLVAGKDHSFWYNGTNFVLSNPGTVTAAETTGLLKSANNLSDVVNAATSLANIGGMAKATYDPQNIAADAFARANQTGTQAQSTIVNLVSDLALKAPLASPALTGNPTAPTQSPNDNSTKLATTAYADAAVVASTVYQDGFLALSGGNLVYSKFSGNFITIAGARLQIPTSGISLAPAGETPGTLYYIYAFSSSGTPTLERSTTVPVFDTTLGYKVKTGDTSRTLVGMARPNAGPVWADTAKQRFTRSWHNDPGVSLFNNFTANRATTSTSYVELNTEIRCEFLLWSGEVAQTTAIGSAINGAASGQNRSSIAFDGTTAETGGAQSLLVDNTAIVPFSAPAIKAGLSEGYHYATLIGLVSSGTGTWYGDVDGRRTSISGRVSR
ncbi:hypothetical protein ATY75_12275 [Rhizobium sp. N122]|uniref:hypothetical protein n=1 Tax=Rhizobium sp. N122 TaxID=1764272 RepID=UPI000B5A71E9|nr:hypothetical protein [Rhizobium sp. N122]OWV62593.1 hypothetical protein ATY75_12275 [Rhizobium sp. N122]